MKRVNNYNRELKKTDRTAGKTTGPAGFSVTFNTHSRSRAQLPGKAGSKNGEQYSATLNHVKRAGQGDRHPSANQLESYLSATHLELRSKN